MCSYRENSGLPIAAYQQDTRTPIESDGTMYNYVLLKKHVEESNNI